MQHDDFECVGFWARMGRRASPRVRQGLLGVYDKLFQWVAHWRRVRPDPGDGLRCYDMTEDELQEHLKRIGEIERRKKEGDVPTQSE